MPRRRHRLRQEPTRAELRDRIRTAELVVDLQANVLGPEPGRMTRDQIRCVEILLKKTLPDLQAVELAGDDLGGSIQITWGKR